MSKVLGFVFQGSGAFELQVVHTFSTLDSARKNNAKHTHLIEGVHACREGLGRVVGNASRACANIARGQHLRGVEQDAESAQGC
jgi:hypothetical protein